jgi:beta-phosphoglucomutase-like phosphatase (HAD superfamily)
MHALQESRPCRLRDEFKVVIDCEGLITDTELEKRLAFVAVSKEFFNLDSPVHAFAWTLGLKRSVIIDRLTKEYGNQPLHPSIVRDTNISLGEQILKRRDELLSPGPTKAMDGAIELLKTLKDNRIPTAIGSSTYEKIGREMLEAAQVPNEFFDVMVWGDHSWVKQQNDPTKRSIFQRAAKDLISPHKVTADRAGCILVIGDARADTWGAKENGFASLLVPDRRIWGDTLDQDAIAEATFVANDLFGAKRVIEALIA